MSKAATSFARRCKGFPAGSGVLSFPESKIDEPFSWPIVFSDEMAELEMLKVVYQLCMSVRRTEDVTARTRIRDLPD